MNSRTLALASHGPVISVPGSWPPITLIGVPEQSIRGPIMVPARMASRTASVSMPRPPQSRMEVMPQRAIFSAFTTELMVRALSLAAKKSAICRVPHTMVLWAWQSITPGRRYFPAPSITVSNTVSPGACPTDRIILSSITTLFTSKSVPFQTFAD